MPIEIEGFEVQTAADGLLGLEKIRDIQPSLVVLDLMPPGTDGFRVLETMRSEGFGMPVLVLTARGEEMDKVRALRLGADDYVTKPFGLMELLARVEALLRRAGADSRRPAESAAFEFGDIQIQTDSRSVTKSGHAVALAPKEYDLLLELCRRNGAIASRLELMRSVWGHTSAVVSRTVDTHIAELRRKLEDDPAAPQYILTVRKAGYRLHGVG